MHHDVARACTAVVCSVCDSVAWWTGVLPRYQVPFLLNRTFQKDKFIQYDKSYSVFKIKRCPSRGRLGN